MTPFLLLAYMLLTCTRQEVQVVSEDMYGRSADYTAPYWLCDVGARPPVPRAIPICFEGRNPYGREVWILPWFSEDIRWLCEPE